MCVRASAFFCALACLGMALPAGADEPQPLQVGWHDELNRSAVRDWDWAPPLGHADLSAPRPGLLRLTLGDRAQPDRANGQTYFWASAVRFAEVDRDRYPVLAVRVLDVHNPQNTWWDIRIQEYWNGENYGPDHRAALTTPNHPGLLLYDLAADAKLSGPKRLRLRLNISGTRTGGWCDYAYVRFVSRDEARRLEANPDLQKVVDNSTKAEAKKSPAGS